jgi:hypothetical protein
MQRVAQPVKLATDVIECPLRLQRWRSQLQLGRGRRTLGILVISGQQRTRPCAVVERVPDLVLKATELMRHGFELGVGLRLTAWVALPEDGGADCGVLRLRLLPHHPLQGEQAVHLRLVRPLPQRLVPHE